MHAFRDPTARATPDAPTLELLAWVAERSRTYAETIEAWGSHCPRLTVWEDALINGLVKIARTGRNRPGRVALTDRGAAVLAEARAA